MIQCTNINLLCHFLGIELIYTVRIALNVLFYRLSDIAHYYTLKVVNPALSRIYFPKK